MEINDNYVFSVFNMTKLYIELQFYVEIQTSYVRDLGGGSHKGWNNSKYLCCMHNFQGIEGNSLGIGQNLLIDVNQQMRKSLLQ